MAFFSRRTHGGLEENDLWRELSAKRAAGERIWDLTESNPTRVGFDYPEREIVECLSSRAALTYEPHPKGLESARRAVADYYRERGMSVSPEDVWLTTGTSEAYSFAFKLLAEPSDRVLVPRPSYPLFDILASLDALEPAAYPLILDGTWRIDFESLESLAPGARALVAVHPNNPTGSFMTPDDIERLLALSESRDLPLIIDEVFLDYSLERLDGFNGDTPGSFAGARKGLVLVLSGLSKIAGLPQLKLGWIVMAGDAAFRREASRRLEHIADAYLSVGTPVQLATPRLLELAPRIRRQIRTRVRKNRAAIARVVESVPAVSLLPVEGGWYQPVRLPAIQSSEAWALELLRAASVYVHPGLFFGFPGEAHLVVSLLPHPAELLEGMERALRVVVARVDSSSA